VTQAQKSSVYIRAARPDEGERLREIAIVSKAYWGYDLDFVRQWAARGDFSAAGLRAKEVQVAEAAGRTIAWAALIARGDVVWLDDLWVEPEWIGKGVGSRLFRWAVERGRAVGGERLGVAGRAEVRRVLREAPRPLPARRRADIVGPRPARHGAGARR
jgi:GNAT superfamily N-acetyltransferase